MLVLRPTKSLPAAGDSSMRGSLWLSADGTAAGFCRDCSGRAVAALMQERIVHALEFARLHVVARLGSQVDVGIFLVFDTVAAAGSHPAAKVS